MLSRRRRVNSGGAFEKPLRTGLRIPADQSPDHVLKDAPFSSTGRVWLCYDQGDRRACKLCEGRRFLSWGRMGRESLTSDLFFSPCATEKWGWKCAG
ncbi:hypothetical protein BaRGS_00014693 [Batillaria attramentaria]|uniref:Uncharacterized protein n=1 Tax=Batillaria attramentaria TaxID=370345 RepID=A0ABD0L4H1_9CAEN